jgi:cellulose synthase/poly-beta-1,6-N-acetylglucosamine synthase-like glycosyltransferase
METALLTGLVVVSLLLSAHGTHTLYLMIYTWSQPATQALIKAPAKRAQPELSFTTIVPARHEEEVIQTTIDRAAGVDYPAHLLQVLVVCAIDDVGTIHQVNQKIDDLRQRTGCDVELVVFDDGPINKPHGLNCALRHARGDVVAIFDAEDEIHPQIISIINTIMVVEKVSLVQAGVQLMNHDSNWYSTFNVLEYFFWFRSRLHYQARHGAIPLGGNTVFFRHELLERLGGWDESNLTEDAEIGLRVSVLGEPVRVFYDDRYVTKEETPPSLRQFIKQRTRWSQGFMQTLHKGTWRQLPTRRQRLLAFYTLAFPHAQAALGVYLPLAVVTALFLSTPLPVALLTWLPALLLVAHFVVAVVGLREFTDAHGLHASWREVGTMALTWVPYQFVLTYAALRAFRRYVRGVNDWEKTQHVGAHRDVARLDPDASP